MKQKENKSVIAVIVTYNRKTLLKESIEALLNQKYKNIKVLVIDNASTDGTQEYIADIIDNDKVNYINTGKNLGGAGASNQSNCHGQRQHQCNQFFHFDYSFSYRVWRLPTLCRQILYTPIIIHTNL